MPNSNWSRSTSRPALAVVGLMLLLCLAGPANPAGGAGIALSRDGATWKLVDYLQTACFDGRVSSAYYGVFIQGDWADAVNVGLTDMPTKDADFIAYYAPISPGSSKGRDSLAYVRLQLNRPLPVGTYQATMWANDGTTTESVPVIIAVRNNCGY